VKDPESSRLKEITLSYTFYPVEGAKAAGQSAAAIDKENRS
jgi:cytochrome c oxidase assembly protein Cox11